MRKPVAIASGQRDINISFEPGIQVGVRSRVLNCVIGECLMETYFDRHYLRAVSESTNPQIQQPDSEELS
jgi:hypothetical protein